jgi:hypothetical protein
MLDDHPTMLGIRIERVRIIPESRDRDAATLKEVADLPGSTVVQSRDIQVRDSCVSSLSLAGRPAHQLDTPKSFIGSEPYHLLQVEIAQNGTYETKLHGVFLRRTCFELPRVEYRHADGASPGYVSLDVLLAQRVRIQMKRTL